MTKPLTLEEVKQFVEVDSNSGCKLISNVYVNNSTKLDMLCSCGEPFQVTYQNFKNKKKHLCNNCVEKKTGRSTVVNTYDKVKNYIEIESNSGCKLLSASYKRNKELLKIQCKCGTPFYKSFSNFQQGQISCNDCVEKRINKKLKMEYDEIKHYIEVESQSGCKLLSTDIVNVKEPIHILCKCGNPFTRSFDNFKNSKQTLCNDCNLNNRAELLKSPYDEIKYYVEVESQSGCKLISKQYKNSKSPLRLKCKCGKPFSRTFSNFKKGQVLCKDCSKTISKGERKIINILDKFDINYHFQYKFNDCRNKNPLPFDFAIFNNSNKLLFVIEFQGVQHYEPIKHFGDIKSFKTRINNDRLKLNYCNENNIEILIIPYYEEKNIKDILIDNLRKHKLINVLMKNYHNK